MHYKVNKLITTSSSSSRLEIDVIRQFKFLREQRQYTTHRSVDIFSIIQMTPINYLNDLQLHPLIGLYSNKAATDGVNDSINELLVHVFWIRALASQLTIRYQLL